MWYELWTLVLVTGFIPLSEMAMLRCYQGSMDNYTTFSLDDPTSVLKSSCFDSSLPTIVYTFGYRGKCTGPATSAMLNGYIDTKKRNVILLDWEEEAKSKIFGISLSYAVFAIPNSKRVGQELGAAILKLYKAGLAMDTLHLIGHSLGAHLMGYTGRWIREQGEVIPRITGLDPARALFEGILATQTGLDRTCAKFVDIVHTNSGNYGTTKSVGTVDIWPNYSSDGMQPGCPRGSHPMFSWDDLCSHNRAVEYFAESLKNGTDFPAASASSYDSWIISDEPSNDTIYLGELVNIRSRGNYYLSTNGQSPYHKGLGGLIPHDQERKRRHVSEMYSLMGILEALIGF
ncbi:unnamed protein product [Pieris brassicae]|uniref:Lipase domain-containing protein n=1 Tax=Pieris brassicae TaxID=7116 RepID=A0A9P0XGD0_PIEBR|nr:unnamed protein product [Pieris brassicae]